MCMMSCIYLVLYRYVSFHQFLFDFRSHHQFVDDCLDAYIVAAACTHFGMEDRVSRPTRNLPSPVLSLRAAQDQYLWLRRQAQSMLKYLLVDHEESDKTSCSMREQMSQLADFDRSIARMKTKDGTYKCNQIPCNKVYKRVGNMKKHLKDTHKWDALQKNSAMQENIQVHVSGPLVTSTFVKMAMLARDTYNAYRYCDGDRVFRNVKQIFLYSECLHHTKYKLWTWRMIAYENSLLSQREAFEYKWNIAVNLEGGSGQNIPNDNCVELQVAKIKKLVQAQGANKTFSSAQMACKISQTVTELKSHLMKISDIAKRGKKRPVVDKSKDIDKLVAEILQSGTLNSENARHLETFDSFKDPLSCINMPKLNTWMKEQKEIMYTMYK